MLFANHSFCSKLICMPAEWVVCDAMQYKPHNRPESLHPVIGYQTIDTRRQRLTKNLLRERENFSLQEQNYCSKFIYWFKMTTGPDDWVASCVQCGAVSTTPNTGLPAGLLPLSLLPNKDLQDKLRNIDKRIILMASAIACWYKLKQAKQIKEDERVL